MKVKTKQSMTLTAILTAITLQPFLQPLRYSHYVRIAITAITFVCRVYMNVLYTK